MCNWEADDSSKDDPQLWWIPPAAPAVAPKPIPPSRGANLAAQLYSASALEAPLARVEAPPKKTKKKKAAASAGTAVTIAPLPMPVATSVSVSAKPKAKKAAAKPKIAKPKKAPSAVKPAGAKKKAPSGSAAIAKAINAAAKSTPKGGVITIKIQK